MPGKTTLISLLLTTGALALASAPAAAAEAVSHASALTAPAPTTSPGLVAPSSVCPDVKLNAAATVQEKAMLCLTNYARGQVAEPQLEEAAALEESAREKAQDIFRCDSFSHYACGREFSFWIREAGYLSSECWRVGENLAWGTGEYGTVRSIFRAGLNTPEHREHSVGNDRQIGIDLKTGSLAGKPDTHVWTQHFGSHCETPSA